MRLVSDLHTHLLGFDPFCKLIAGFKSNDKEEKI